MNRFDGNAGPVNFSYDPGKPKHTRVVTDSFSLDTDSRKHWKDWYDRQNPMYDHYEGVSATDESY